MDITPNPWLRYFGITVSLLDKAQEHIEKLRMQTNENRRHFAPSFDMRFSRHRESITLQYRNSRE
jgi:hypothetical protein